MTITEQVIGLTGDGHGRHIPGTPDVYKHGFIPIDGTELGEDGIRRPGGKEKPGGVLTGPHPADKLTVASNPRTVAKGMSGDDLNTADKELSRRAALLGKPGRQSKAQKAVRAEMAARDGHGGISPATPADIRALLARPVGADVKKDTAPLFEGKYGDFTVKVDSAQVVRTPDGGKAAEVNASVYNKDGQKVGIVVRGLHAGQDGARVHNAEMLLSPKYQGQGFASEFTKQTEARLKAAGVKEASLRANQDVGGYAWARKGFDWADPGEGQKKVGDLASWYKGQPHPDPAVTKEIAALAARAKDPASAQFPAPFDLSRVGYQPGASTWPGKEFLLGTGWDGVKTL